MAEDRHSLQTDCTMHKFWCAHSMWTQVIYFAHVPGTWNMSSASSGWLSSAILQIEAVEVFTENPAESSVFYTF